MGKGLNSASKEAGMLRASLSQRYQIQEPKFLTSVLVNGCFWAFSCAGASIQED